MHTLIKHLKLQASLRRFESVALMLFNIRFQSLRKFQLFVQQDVDCRDNEEHLWWKGTEVRQDWVENRVVEGVLTDRGNIAVDQRKEKVEWITSGIMRRYGFAGRWET